MSDPLAQPAVMVDGALVPPGAPALIEMDDGLVRGDGIFEGMRTYGRRPRTPEEHLERLARSADGAEIAIDLDQLRRELADFCQATSAEDCAVRLMVTRGGRRIFREEPIPPRRDSIGLLPVPHRVTPLLVGVKTLSYAANMRAQRQAKAQGMDDALFVRADDRAILEGPTTSFAWLEGDTLVFPPLAIGVLDSITRRVASAAVSVREREMPVEGLADADGAFLLSSVMEIVPVATVLGVAELEVDGRRVREMAAAVREAILGRVEEVGAERVAPA